MALPSNVSFGFPDADDTYLNGIPEDELEELDLLTSSQPCKGEECAGPQVKDTETGGSA